MPQKMQQQQNRILKTGLDKYTVKQETIKDKETEKRDNAIKIVLYL